LSESVEVEVETDAPPLTERDTPPPKMWSTRLSPRAPRSDTYNSAVVAAATAATDATDATDASNKPSHTPWRSPVLNLLALLVQKYK
jgi:hypothetical protein